MSAVDDAIEDRVREGWAGQKLVPVFGGQLARDERGSTAVAVFQDFKQIASLGIRERSHSPVIEDEEICFGQLPEQLCIGSVCPRERELTEETADAKVAC